MKFLVIGLGSMGKRRVRNLQALGIETIAGFDLREDRRDEAKAKYGIEVFSDYKEALNSYEPDAFVISTSPDHHMYYAWSAVEKDINCFIEASVVDAEKIKELDVISKQKGVVVCPSCSMGYYPGPKKVKELIDSGVIGKVLNINYQTGQYLPDWHPWESIEEFYVSKRDTGGCREIVPFELTWINKIFGDAQPIACVYSKQTDMPVDIDDIYHCLLRYPSGVLLNMTVEVISRPKATRNMRIIGSKGEIVFCTDESVVRYIAVNDEDWTKYDIAVGTVETQYINPEEPYIEEMSDFVAAVKERNQALYPNNLIEDYKILQTLYELEDIASYRVAK
jgi:predicted dehydrogenase